MKVVSNASILISLSTIGRLPLLQDRFPNGITAPRAVWREVVLEGGMRPGALEVAKASWIQIQDIASSSMMPLLLAGLDEGEAESIALAVEIKADVILLDERDARRAAGSMGLKVLGTVGILIWARRTGRLPSSFSSLGNSRPARPRGLRACPTWSFSRAWRITA